MFLRSSRRKLLRRFPVPGHARALNFCCDDMKNLLNDVASNIFVEEVGRAREMFGFKLWAYAVMPNHAHLLVWPVGCEDKIPAILQQVKGRTSKRYSELLKQMDDVTWGKHAVSREGQRVFRLWMRGGGYDRNLWKPRPVYAFINYIEQNPVRAGLVKNPEDWPWSSAWTRHHGKGLVPDKFQEGIIVN